MDLISRKELIENITNDTVIENHMKDYIVNIINGMETAYDVEKVVEQMETFASYLDDDNEADTTAYALIDIVKGGL
jgi:hypothetical protein